MKLQLLLSTSVTKNFDWEGPKMKNFMTFFDDVVVMIVCNAFFKDQPMLLFVTLHKLE